MAKQTGIFTIEGTLGNATFLKTKDGYLVKEKSSISAQRIASDPAFARTRENMAEFAKAGKAAKLFRTTFKSIIHGNTDHRMVSRLVTQMLAVIKMDRTSIRGQRNVIDSEAILLEGFEFNNNGSVTKTLQAPVTAAVNRVSGEVTVNIPAFIPARMLAAPGGATHFMIKTAAALVDFEKETGQVEEKESAWLPVDNLATLPLNLVMQLTAAGTVPIFVLLSVEFAQEVNTTKYSLQNGAYNACAVIAVDTGV